jgi:TorA maturation chaperone TorD
MNKEATQDLINMFGEKLKRYREQLHQNPGSTFYDGLVKNTEELIEELKQQIKHPFIPL